MRNNTRLLYAAYLAQVAQLNQIGDATLSFNVDPAVQQTLEQRTQESSEFLSQINMIGVEELKGEKVGIGVSSTIAGRTDTSGAGRLASVRPDPCRRQDRRQAGLNVAHGRMS